MTAQLSPLRKARIDAVKAHLRARAKSAHLYQHNENTVSLGKGTYGDLRRLGISKADVDLATEQMVERGEAQFLSTSYSGVLLRVIR